MKAEQADLDEVIAVFCAKRRLAKEIRELRGHPSGAGIAAPVISNLRALARLGRRLDREWLRRVSGRVENRPADSTSHVTGTR